MKEIVSSTLRTVSTASLKKEIQEEMELSDRDDIWEQIKSNRYNKNRVKEHEIDESSD